jgi:hypothetical protein
MFSKGDVFDPSIQVIIRYHSYDKTEEIVLSNTTPTPEPTANETTAPTSAPTAETTPAPTATPTPKPTATPTPKPTATPTPKPTATPTPKPTATPTPKPTATPTPKPTATPTPVSTDPADLFRLCTIKGSNYADVSALAYLLYGIDYNNVTPILTKDGFYEATCYSNTEYYRLWLYRDTKELLYCQFASTNINEYRYFTNMTETALADNMTSKIYNWVMNNVGSNKSTTINGIYLKYTTSDGKTGLEICDSKLAELIFNS